MAEEDSADAIADVFKGASKGGGSSFPLSRESRRQGAAQNAADLAPPPPPPADADAIASTFRPSPLTTPTPGKDEPTGFFGTIKKAASDLVADVAGGIHLPGSSGPQPVEALKTGPAIAEPHTLAGIRRGVKDVTDTVRLTSTSDAERKAFEAEHGDSGWTDVGRTIGQTVATAPIGAGVGRLIGAGAGYIPGVTGRVAQWITGATPAASTAGRGVQLGIQGAAQGAGQAAATSASSDTPVGEQIAQGATTGAIAGPVMGALTKGFDVARGYFPGARKEIAELADRLRTLTQSPRNPEGVVVPATQLSTNPTLRIMSDAARTFPGSGADAYDLARQRGVQAALARLGGLTNVDQLGTAEMTMMRDRIRAGYNSALAQVGSVAGGQPLYADLAKAGTDASRFISGDREAMAAVGNAIREVGQAFRSGPITADSYRALTNATDGVLTRIEAGAPSAASPYLQQVRNALRARLEASAGPDLAQELRVLDSQYRTMHTLRPLSKKATTGDIGLGGLQQEVNRVSEKFDAKNAGTAFTKTPISEIGDATKQFFGHVPESGTTPRAVAVDLARNPLAAVGYIPGLTLGRYGQRYLRGPVFSGRVIDTSLGRPTPDVGRFVPYGVLGPIDREREMR